MTDQEERITMQETPRSFYYQVPNLINDLGLSHVAIHLYCHYRRIAGEDGECYRSMDTLAKECGMSKATVFNARKELEKTGLIHVRSDREHQRAGGRKLHHVTVLDIWELNHQYGKGFITLEEAQSVLRLNFISTEAELHSSAGVLEEDPGKKTPMKNTRINPGTTSRAEGQPSSKKKPSRKSKADPRTTHPAIQAWRQVCGVYPNKIDYPSVISVLGETPDLEVLQKVRQAWVTPWIDREGNERRNNPYNTRRILDWYVQGIPAFADPEFDDTLVDLMNQVEFPIN